MLFPLLLHCLYPCVCGSCLFVNTCWQQQLCFADRRSAQGLFVSSSPKPSLAAQLLPAGQGCLGASVPPLSLRLPQRRGPKPGSREKSWQTGLCVGSGGASSLGAGRCWGLMLGCLVPSRGSGCLGETRGSAGSCCRIQDVRWHGQQRGFCRSGNRQPGATTPPHGVCLE